MKKLLPTYGIMLFGILGVIASFYYPGGSQADPTSEGFSWAHNYWCNLLYTWAINGETNPAQPVAIAATLVLFASLAYFFYQFPKYFSINKIWDRLIRFTGVGAMVLAVLVFSHLHDLFGIICSVMGLVTLVGIFYGVVKHRQRVFAVVAVWCILLVGMNNYIYFSENYIHYLPIVQKITFASVLLWVIGINIQFLKLGRKPVT